MKSKGVAYLLWCAGLFGLCGLHRFYIGKIGTGLLWLFTLGLLGLGQLIDLFTLGGQVDMINMKGGLAGQHVDQKQNVVVNVTAPAATSDSIAATANTASSTEQLEKLAKLLEQGHITQEEFEAQKSRLLTS